MQMGRGHPSAGTSSGRYLPLTNHPGPGTFAISPFITYFAPAALEPSSCPPRAEPSACAWPANGAGPMDWEDRTMKRISRRNGVAASSFLFAGLVLAGVVVPLAAEQSNSLSITGHTGSAKIVQVEGHDFVEVEGLARLINASVRFTGNQIVITLPGGGDTPP